MRAIAFRAENVEEILGSYFEEYDIREADAHHTLRLIEEAQLEKRMYFIPSFITQWGFRIGWVCIPETSLRRVYTIKNLGREIGPHDPIPQDSWLGIERKTSAGIDS